MSTRKREINHETALFFKKLSMLTGQTSAQLAKMLGWSRQKYFTYEKGLVRLSASDPKLLGQKLHLRKSDIKRLLEEIYL